MIGSDLQTKVIQEASWCTVSGAINRASRWKTLVSSLGSEELPCSYRCRFRGRSHPHVVVSSMLLI